MADVKWIKIVTDIFDDEKIRFIETLPNGNEIIVIWFRLLCLCGKANAGGFLMLTNKLAYTDDMLSSIFNRDIKIIQMALNTFQNLEMIEMIDNKIYIANWDKHQSLDKLEAKKLYDKEYQKKRRKEKKLMLENRTTVVRQSNDNRSLDIDIEEDKELDIYNNQQEEEDIYNNARANLIDFFSNEIGRPLSPIEMELVLQWEKDYSPDLVKLALKEAVVNNKRTFKYIEAILVSWKGKGIRTAIEAQQEIEQFNNRKSSATSDELEDIKKQYCIMRNSAETIDNASQLRMRYYNLTGRDIEEDVQDD